MSVKSSSLHSWTGSPLWLSNITLKVELVQHTSQNGSLSHPQIQRVTSRACDVAGWNQSDLTIRAACSGCATRLLPSMFSQKV